MKLSDKMYRACGTVQISASRTVFVCRGRVSEMVIKIPRTAGAVDVLTASGETTARRSQTALMVSPQSPQASN